ncbi:MAG: malto-oligosyltrehalose trehalohydrolase [Planctomycetota bacterium]|nr:malto-oligosyltrehalose trehalohydrolase [Planctomycetota bacterium]
MSRAELKAETGNPSKAAAPIRRLPIGAEPQPDGGAHFRIWAPKRNKVEVVREGSNTPGVELKRDGSDYFSGFCADAGAGALYRFRLDASDPLLPDPASRFQPQGPHGPSQIIDPATFKWTDGKWAGVSAHGQVLYEMHIGTFTQEGTYEAAARELPELKSLGITCLEVMPVNEFPGKFGWGYDGVDLFAPFHHYGSPDDFRRFVDRAHALGIGIILDLVYNHLGPDGNYLKEFSPAYFNAEHHTDWGDALNFDGQDSQPVREFFVSNAIYWVTEFHLDGFRFDATQAIVDTSPHHILAEITQSARKAAGKRTLYLINENEPQHTKLVRPPESGGYGMDALWNDDFHHSALVALSGHSEAYYVDHPGTPQEFISAAKWGYLFQGQRYAWQKRRRGTYSLDLPPTAFVHFLQNHDQVANSGRGYRVHQISSPGQFKAMTALWLLMPQTPMLFQGQEFAASNPFLYFADHHPALARLVCAGRAKELSQFPSVASAEMQSCLHDPGDEKTFLRSKLEFSERHKPMHAEIYQLHKDLLKLRHSEAVFRRVQKRGDIDGAVLGPGALVLRYFAQDGDDWLVIVNFERDLPLVIAPEPLLAPPDGKRWKKVLSTEDPVYGGSGTAPLDTEQEGWHIPGRCAVVLKPVSADEGEILSRIKGQGSAQAPKKKTETTARG